VEYRHKTYILQKPKRPLNNTIQYSTVAIDGIVPQQPSACESMAMQFLKQLVAFKKLVSMYLLFHALKIGWIV
jgi:hypothetical protein